MKKDQPISNSILEGSLIELEINKIRESGLLGKRGRIIDLFEYLATTHQAKAAPKESELSIQVFKKKSLTDSDDASVRVCAHRLRKKLATYYSDNPSTTGDTLTLPKGEYRLVLQQHLPQKNQNVEHSLPLSRKWLGALLLSLFCINMFAWKFFTNNDEKISAVEINPIWQEVNKTKRPIIIVVGDYYLYSEQNEFGLSKRLVRDYLINSSLDLERAKQSSTMPDQKGQQKIQDIGLQYLPVSTACALKDILPLIKQQGRVINIVQASKATPSIFKDNDVIYIGLLSGLSFLKTPVFSKSAYQVGTSFDEIIDTQAGKTYSSGEPSALSIGDIYQDYGYFSFIKTSENHKFIVLAGTRDTGLCGVTNAMSQPQLSEKLQTALNRTTHIEALLEVQGHDQINMNERVLSVREH